MKLDKQYAEVGFKVPDYIENSYGIKIYIGTKDKEDWCVEIPQRLTEGSYAKYKQSLTFYGISEQMALRMAKKYTNIAKTRRSI